MLSIQRIEVLLSVLLLLFCPSCAPYKVCTPCTIAIHGRVTDDPCILERRQEASEHWLYTLIPRHRCQIRCFDLLHWGMWALFGNDDDGIFGEEPSAQYKPCDPSTGWKASQWSLRNPLHNFCFYVIGTAQRTQHSEFAFLQLAKCNSHFICYKPEAQTVFAGKDNGLFIGLHGGLPFISLNFYYGRCFQFYCGWRERGNFGLKFAPARCRVNDLGLTENSLESEAEDPV